MSRNTHGCYAETLLWREGHANHFAFCSQRPRGTSPASGSLVLFAYLTVDIML